MNEQGIEPEEVGPLSAKVLEYERTFKRVAASARQPGFSRADWAPLAELVAVDEFERVGIWRDVMNWQEYTDMLTQFAAANDFQSSRQRIAEAGGRVFFDREERHIKNGEVSVVNAMSVYEFDESGRIRRLDVYIQGQPAREAR